MIAKSANSSVLLAPNKLSPPASPRPRTNRVAAPGLPHDGGGKTKRVLAEAKRQTSYSSHSALTSKMWILPDGRVVSFGTQHYEWALTNAVRLREEYGIDLRRARPVEDTRIRMYLLRRGCVRVNYEHRGGRLMVEACERRWSGPQRKGCKAIVAANFNDISFVEVRLLTLRGWIADSEYVTLMKMTRAKAMRRLPLMEHAGGVRLRRL